MIFAYLDDIYVISDPARTRQNFNLIQASLRDIVGIDINLGKCKCWNKANIEFPRMAHANRNSE